MKDEFLKLLSIVLIGMITFITVCLGVEVMNYFSEDVDNKEIKSEKIIISKPDMYVDSDAIMDSLLNNMVIIYNDTTESGVTVVNKL